MYREAMRSWTEHENTFRTDALQVSQTHRHVADFKHLRLTIEILTFSLGCKNFKSTSLLTSNMVKDSFCTEFPIYSILDIPLVQKPILCKFKHF